MCIRSMAWQPLGSNDRFDDCIHFAEAPLPAGYEPRTQMVGWLAAMLKRFAAPWDAACSSHCMVNNARWTALSHEHWLPLPLPACLPELALPLGFKFQTRPVRAAQGAGCCG